MGLGNIPSRLTERSLNHRPVDRIAVENASVEAPTMKNHMRILQGLKLAAVLALALSMGACAKNPLAFTLAPHLQPINHCVCFSRSGGV